MFIWSSTCLWRHTAHHQEPKTALAASGFAYVKRLLDIVVAGCCPATTASNNLFTYAKPEAASAVLGSWWWAVCRPKHVELHNKIKFGTLWHLVGFSIWIIYYDAWIHKRQDMNDVQLHRHWRHKVHLYFHLPTCILLSQDKGSVYNQIFNFICCQYFLWQETDWCSGITEHLYMADNELKIRFLTSGIQVLSATMVPLQPAW
jgi:hypothetical protein